MKHKTNNLKNYNLNKKLITKILVISLFKLQ